MTIQIFQFIKKYIEEENALKYYKEPEVFPSSAYVYDIMKLSLGREKKIFSCCAALHTIMDLKNWFLVIFWDFENCSNFQYIFYLATW